MSKKYFINNLDTPFGQALLGELVKEPTEDPVHMCTVRAAVDQKPQGVKKVLKRDKPKLFRKKAIEDCQVYVYSLDQTEISDIQFGIETMNKPFEDNKVFILVSDIMAWSNSPRKVKKDPPPPPPEEGDNPPPPEEEKPKEEEQEEEPAAQNKSQEEHSEKEPEPEKPIEYTFYEDGDFADREPLPKYSYIKEIEEKVLAIKKENVKVFVVCPGIIYGCGEDTYYQLFKASWLQQPQKLPYLDQGHNQIPTIHLKDLVKLVIKVAESPPEGSPYLLALDQTENRTQKSLIQAISSGIGSGKVTSVKQSPLIENPDRYTINIDMRSSKFLVGTAEEPAEFEWTARKGISDNINSLLKDFCEKEQLRPMKIVMLQQDSEWKDSKISFIHKAFSDYYRIPVLDIKSILQNVKEFADEELCCDIKEQWTAILDYLNNHLEVKELTETMKVFIRAIRWRLTQNDCTNRGFILSDFPHFSSELQYIFKKISLKKLKRKKPKPVPVPVPKPSQQSIPSQGDIPPPEQPEEPKQEEPVEEEEPAEEEEEGGPKTEPYFPESLVTIKLMGKKSQDEVVNFFIGFGKEDLVYDTTDIKEHEIFESLRNYIERNGKPKNYLESDQELFKKHREFVDHQNKGSLERRDQKVKVKDEAQAEARAKRQKLSEDMIDLVKNEGEQEIKKMPFRNYLMEFVVPTLNEGLLEVSNIIPNDPVDLLAEYLYQKSYDV